MFVIAAVFFHQVVKNSRFNKLGLKNEVPINTDLPRKAKFDRNYAEMGKLHFKRIAKKFAKK